MVPFWARFLAVAAAQPERPALRSGSIVITYAELQDRARRLAAVLQEAGVEAGELVGLHLDKSIEYVVAVLGCWAAGAAFVPLAPQLPPARLRALARDAQLRLAIGRPEHMGVLPDLSPDLTWISALASHPVLIQGSARAVLWAAPAAQLAYVIYTSGSTGTPKGVMVGHGGLVALLDAQIAAFGLTAQSRVLLYLSISFDASVSDLGTALLAGACVCIEPSVERLSPAALVRCLQDLGITHLDLPPALLRVVDPESLPAALTTLIIGGEVCPPAVVRRHAARRRVINVYGPTEATICVSLCACDAERWQEPLLGQPIPGVQFQVTADDLSAAAPGMPGELWIAGAALALGYLNQPALTAARFLVQNGVRFYRTGDRVVQRPDGELIYLGRLDRQLKLHGRLIAPEEVEAALLRQPGVQRAAVLCRQELAGRPALFAYLAGDGIGAPEAVRARLAAELPAWLVPQRVIVLPVLPETASGKVDLAALVERKEDAGGAAAAMPGSGSPDSEPQLAMARLLQGVCSAVLGVRVELDDDFNALGGDSLAAMEVAAGAEAAGLAVAPELLWTERTPRNVAAALAADTAQKCSWVELRADAMSVLGADRPVLPAVSPQSGPADGAQVLLTGGTGQLGPHLLSALLSDGAARVWCLVRAADEAAARMRLREALARNALHLTEPQWERVRLVPGDVSRPRLGLAAVQWAELSATITEVHHLAAHVNAVLPYKALRTTNLLGTREILRLCQTGPRKRLHHASTLSVALSTSGDRAEPDRIGVYGGYAQSKAAAEALLDAAAHPATWCHRLGLLTGASSGSGPGAADPLTFFLRGLVALGRIPAGLQQELCVDVTPVDWAAKVLVSLRRAEPGTYAVSASYRGVSLGTLLEALRTQGVALQVVPPAALYSGSAAARHPAALAACLALLAAVPGAGPPAARPGALFILTEPLAAALPFPAPELPPLDALLARYVTAALGRT